jgi:predicted nucleic acid-binding protein
MRYILDASVAVKWVLPEKDSPKAVRLLNAYRKKNHELIAPDTFKDFPFIRALATVT